jgi:uncharacterized protein
VTSPHFVALAYSAVALGAPALIAAAASALEHRCSVLGAHLAAQAALALATIVLLAVGIANAAEYGVPLSLAPPTLWTLPLAAMMALLFVLGIGPWLMALPARLGLAGFEGGLRRLDLLPTWALVLAIVVGALCEELLYRALAFTTLAATLGALAALLIASVAFGISHAVFWGFGPALSTALSGGLFTAAYALHGDIHANILAHAVVDAHGLIAARRCASGASK